MSTLSCLPSTWFIVLTTAPVRYLRLQLLTAERAWAHAMMMKASHSADTKAITGRTRSHMVSRLDKGARLAEKLARTLQDTASGATGTDALEARAYAAMLRGAALFELQRWEPCLGNYSIARIIYSALSTATKGDIFKDLLSETLDPSIRYAAYQLKIPRTEPVPTIAQKAFPHSDARLVELVTKLSATALGHDDADDKQAFPASAGAPTTLTWRNREVKIEDAAISAAWAAVGTAKARLAETLSSPSLEPKDRAAAYDDILNASQDAVDSTKQAIDELKAEGVPQSDSRMQSLQITRTAVHFDMISWRIGRNRVLTGAGDGAAVTFGAPGERAKKTKARLLPPVPKEEAPGRLLAKLREKAVLYDGTLQSIESITELPGVANDQELSRRLEATTGYFTALKYAIPW